MNVNIPTLKIGTPATGSPTAGNFRWKIIALLFFATTINYIDRQVIGILKPFIAKDLNWSEADYGYIVTAFQIAYAIGLLVTGRFLDALGTRLGYLWAVVVWSLAGIAHAAATGVLSFGVARFVLGLGEAANFPAAVKSVAEWFPRKERALATGIFNSGSTVGAIVSPVMVSGITVALGWQWAFILTGGLGFVWLLFWLAFYHHPSGHPKLSASEAQYILQDDENGQNQEAIRWSRLLGYRQTGAICLTRFISDWVWWFMLFWVPDFLSKTYGVSIKEVVLPLIIIYATSSVGGIGGGWLSSRFIKSGKSIDYARKTTILLCALLVLPLVLVSLTQNLWVVVGILALAAAGHQGWAANMFTIISDIFPKKAVGTVTGISGFCGAIGGALSASFVGLVLEKTNNYFLIFFIAASMYLFNWLIIKILIPQIKPIVL